MTDRRCRLWGSGGGHGLKGLIEQIWFGLPWKPAPLRGGWPLALTEIDPGELTQHTDSIGLV